MNQEYIKFFANYIESQLGIVYAEANYFQLEHRLEQIVTQLGLGSIDELYKQAIVGLAGASRTLLLDVATNNETSFFRDAAVFRMFSEKIIPERMSQGHQTEISVWSAASSSGQEPYSILMEYDMARKKNPLLPSLRLLASDVSEAMIERTKNGVYSQLEVQRGLAARNLIQYFDKLENDSWKIKESLRVGLEQKKINLLHDYGYIGPFDVVFCRNVLIYQSVPNKKMVISKIAEKLRPGGYLLLGGAESILGLSESFDQVEHEGALGYRLRA